MKRLLLFISLIFSVQLVFAHAGMFDRYLERVVSSEAILVTVSVTHIVLLLLVKILGNRLKYYKLGLRKITWFVSQRKATALFASWLLCSFVYGIYLSLLSDQIFLFGGFIGLIFLLVFSILLWINKTNKRFILGFRPLYYYLQSTIFILVGLILYYVLCQYDWYRECFVLVDEVCDNLSRNLYPKRYGLIVLANSVKEYVLCFLVSYTILGICYLCKYASNRKRTRHNQ